jgi:hypothetical protein
MSNDIKPSRIKIPKHIIDKLKNSSIELEQLEHEVRNMERAKLPSAVEHRERLEKLKDQINSIVVVYG